MPQMAHGNLEGVASEDGLRMRCVNDSALRVWVWLPLSGGGGCRWAL